METYTSLKIFGIILGLVLLFRDVMIPQFSCLLISSFIEPLVMSFGPQHYL
jgi:hypothetical protein